MQPKFLEEYFNRAARQKVPFCLSTCQNVLCMLPRITQEIFIFLKKLYILPSLFAALFLENQKWEVWL